MIQIRRKHTREEIVDQCYLSIEDVRTLFEVGYKQARRIYEIADKIDTEQLTAVVSMKTVPLIGIGQQADTSPSNKRERRSDGKH